MPKKIFNPKTLAPPVGHFDRAVQLGDWLFISGTSALTGVSGPMNERRLVQGIEAQTHTTLDNIEKVLKDAGARPAQVYEVRMIVRKREYFAVVDRILKQRWPEKGFIAHGYEGVLLHPEMELEIEANAYLGKAAGGVKRSAGRARRPAARRRAKRKRR
ncbi:MAG: RidA family protein [Alphaproteobacteria bacterium]|nr:RidA family protein [Alphaproteobacteria bacterium]